MITEYEKENTIATNRFLTTNKQKAFELAHCLNAEQEIKADGSKPFWSIGIAIRDRIAIDIDNHNIENMKNVWKFYSNLYKNDFKIIKTFHGYHLIQKNKENIEEIQFSRCQVLCPFLSFLKTEEFEREVDLFFQKLKKEREQKEYSLRELQERSKKIPEMATKAGLNYSKGDIDVLHALLGIQKKKYVLRISKKNEKDMFENYELKGQ